jgi:membrane fusion protein (multidrug efflux system)
VRAGQRVKATSAAFGERAFEGVIVTVDSRIDRVSRAFKVRAKIPNHDLTLPAGMFMLVELTLAERDALTVPEEAVVAADDDNDVFVIVDDKAERRPVTLGQRNFGEVEIVDGLSAGERVVVRGIQRVKAGDTVKVLNDIEDGGDAPSAPPPAAAEPSA